MNIRMPMVLFALLAFAQSCLLLPAAAANSGTQADRTPAAVLHQPAPLACPANLKVLGRSQVVQLDCCKGHKGLCGCRAGKIVCCDGTVSTEPGCTCHGDEGVTE
jgi:hypothetical protein